jgi:biotin-(acetyl-CoA carboxylase) ligase
MDIGLSCASTTIQELRSIPNSTLTTIQTTVSATDSEGMFLKEWRKRSYTIGKIVEVRKPFNKYYDGYVVGISREGALVVEKIDGSLEKVISGECIIKN